MVRALAVLLVVLAAGCSKPPDPLPPEPVKPQLADVLQPLAADKGLSDEQALQGFCKVLNERAGELNLLAPVPPKAGVKPADGGGWRIESHVRDKHEASFGPGIANAEALAEQNQRFTMQGLCNTVTTLLEKGKGRNLKAVRMVVYTPTKGDGGPVKEVEAFRVLATQDDLPKILGWYLWPNFRPKGYEGGDKDRLEQEMWTVEKNEYPNIHLKKR